MSQTQVDELKAAIRRDPHDPAPYLVLADLLQTSGDPRGELISVQEALAAVPTDRLRELEEDLLEQYQEALLGPLHTALEELGPLPGRQRVAFEWRRGFLRKVAMRVKDKGREQIAIARAIGASPAAVFLEAFEIATDFYDPRQHKKLLATLCESLPPTLRELAIKTEFGKLDLRPLWPRVPQLRALRLDNDNDGLVLGDLAAALPDLEELELAEVKSDAAEKLLARPPRKLRRLELVIPDTDGGGMGLLAGVVPNLVHIGLRQPYSVVDYDALKLSPTTTSLRLEPVASASIEIIAAHGKHLHALDLTLDDDPTREELAPLLDGDQLPALRQLGLEGYFEFRMFAKAKLLSRLELLVLRNVEENDLDELVRVKSFAQVGRIELRESPRLCKSYRKDDVERALKLPNARLIR